MSIEQGGPTPEALGVDQTGAGEGMPDIVPEGAVEETPPREEGAQPEKTEEVKTPQEVFLNALDEELSAMEQSGTITPDRSEGKRRSASLIETGFSDDPKHDALMFSRAGISEEREMIDILNRSNQDKRSLTPDNVRETDPVAGLIEVSESMKRAYGQRLQRGIPDSERAELEWTIRCAGKVGNYFRSIAPRIGQGLTVEQVIAEDRDRLRSQGDQLDIEGELSDESLLRLAEMAVNNEKENR